MQHAFEECEKPNPADRMGRDGKPQHLPHLYVWDAKQTHLLSTPETEGSLPAMIQQFELCQCRQQLYVFLQFRNGRLT